MRAVACIRTSKLFAASVGIAATQAGATADLDYQGVGPDCLNQLRKKHGRWIRGFVVGQTNQTQNASNAANREPHR